MDVPPIIASLRLSWKSGLAGIVFDGCWQPLHTSYLTTIPLSAPQNLRTRFRARSWCTLLFAYPSVFTAGGDWRFHDAMRGILKNYTACLKPDWN